MEKYRQQVTCNNSEIRDEQRFEVVHNDFVRKAFLTGVEPSFVVRTTALARQEGVHPKDSRIATSWKCFAARTQTPFSYRGHADKTLGERGMGAFCKDGISGFLKKFSL